jgi:16S rRNA (guanine966-N2)-methyltransferase
VRVVAGALGGRRLVAPRGDATRPTGERVREALFSVLFDVEGAVVLDLFAGTGALGIEALSRGASRAVHVESGRPALAALRDNLRALGLQERAVVVARPVARARDELVARGPYDLVLCDPPWAELANAQSELAALATAGALGPGCRVVLEHAAADAPPDIEGLVRRDARTYGDTALAFYEPLCPSGGQGPAP